MKPQLVGVNGQKYYSLGYRSDGKMKHMMVHKIVAKLFIPNPENKKYVNHKNGNKLDNRVVNLEWVTAKENCEHAYRIGLKDSKPVTGVSSMKKINIDELKADYLSGINQVALSKKYNIHQSNISRLLK